MYKFNTCFQRISHTKRMFCGRISCKVIMQIVTIEEHSKPNRNEGWFRKDHNVKQDKLKDTKVVIRSHTPKKDRQYKKRKKTIGQRMIYKTLYRKRNIEQY